MPEIFVFGSNLAGVHRKGAALYAKKYFGAIEGIGIGLQGASYAIPTKDANLNVLPLDHIEAYIIGFCETAKVLGDDYKWLITPVGCGLAGYSEDDIAPIFRRRFDVYNMRFAQSWKLYDAQGRRR